MQLEVVNIEDVYPDENNPRKTFEGIEDLAESFELNTERPGEPFTPPILVRDGGIFRIVDGERRYKALKLRRKTSFTANVCEDLDEVNTLMAMLATDNKQPLSDIEKSRGVQQALLLGVDPVKIDKTTKGAHAKHIKKAMELVDDAAEDMSLDRLLAIEEFSEYPGIVEKLTNCRERDWEKIADYERKRLKDEKRMLAVRDALLERGYSICDSDDKSDNYYYAGAIRTVKEAEELTDSPDEVVFTPGVGNQSYEKLKLREEEEGQVSVIAQIRKLKDTFKESEEKRMLWFGERMGDPDNISHLRDLVVKAFVNFNSIIIDRFTDDFQINMDCTPCKLVMAVGYDKITNSILSSITDSLDSPVSTWELPRFKEYSAVIEAFILDGYVPDQWELDLFDKIKHVIDITEEALND